MTGKHTPGPWVAQTDPCHYDTLSDVVGGDGNLFVSVGGKASWQEQEANARLIAAAPELLEALVEVGECVRTYETEYDGRMYEICSGCDAQLSDGQSHRSSCTWLKVDAALAKAEGKE